MQLKREYPRDAFLDAAQRVSLLIEVQCLDSIVEPKQEALQVSCLFSPIGRVEVTRMTGLRHVFKESECFPKDYYLDIEREYVLAVALDVVRFVEKDD